MTYSPSLNQCSRSGKIRNCGSPEYRNSAVCVSRTRATILAISILIAAGDSEGMASHRASTAL
jgi:hypothetical protein